MSLKEKRETYYFDLGEHSASYGCGYETLTMLKALLQDDRKKIHEFVAAQKAALDARREDGQPPQLEDFYVAMLDVLEDEDAWRQFNSGEDLTGVE